MNRKLILAVLLLILLMLIGVRAVHLLADFPVQLNWSGDLYTDEGWYSSGAMRAYLSGQWLMPGDFNPVLSMPFFQLAAYVAFELAGMSLLTARVMEVVFFLALIVGLGLLLRLFLKDWHALIVLALLSVDYLTFLYSRLAFLELPMLALVVWSLYLVELARVKEKAWLLVPSGLLFLLALLTKTSAVFALPVLVLAAAYGWPNRRFVIFRPLLFASTSFFPFALYSLIIHWRFPADAHYFNTINFQNRLVLVPAAVIKNFSEIFLNPPLRDLPVFWALLLLFGASLLFARGIFRSRLVHILALLLLSYVAMLSFSTYRPLRYLVPAVVLFNGLCGLAIAAFLTPWKGKAYQWAVVALAAGLLVFNAGKDFRYLAHPQYTFVHMLTDVKSKLPPPGSRPPVIVGPFANTAGLELSVATVNSFQGTQDLAWRIQQYQPDYYLALGEDPKELETLGKYYTLDRIGQYDVLQNYYFGRSVTFYRLNRR